MSADLRGCIPVAYVMQQYYAEHCITEGTVSELYYHVCHAESEQFYKQNEKQVKAEIRKICAEMIDSINTL